MPTQVILVHDDHAVLDSLSDALRANGHEVVALDSPSAAWDALSDDCRADVLITRIRFPNGTPHGLALARRAHSYCRHVQAVFIAPPEMAPYTDGLGLFVATPINPAVVAEVVGELLEDRLD